MFGLLSKEALMIPELEDVPAEVPDEVDPQKIVIEPTPLDEDNSRPDDAVAELDALLA